MLSSKNRFHGHGSLKYVFRNGQTVRSRYLVIRHTVNPRRSRSRVAVVVSKKVHRSAVRRNRIRRRIYEIVRPNLVNIDGRHDLVIIVTSPEADSLTHQQLTEQIIGLLTGAGLYKSPL